MVRESNPNRLQQAQEPHESSDFSQTRGNRTSPLWEQELALERQVDALLRSLPPDPDYPAFTEEQLLRHGKGYCVADTNCWVEAMIPGGPSQTFLEELTFVASLTHLTRRERICLRGWMLGWTQKEMSDLWNSVVGSQQEVSRILHTAVLKCFEVSELSFAHFSRHTIYRRPLRRNQGVPTRLCLYCHETFVRDLGCGRFCSISCREASRHR